MHTYMHAYTHAYQQVKLCDFGLSASTKSAYENSMNEMFGTRRFAAPEMIEIGLVKKKAQLVFVYMCVRVCVGVCVHAYICICVYIYIYIYIYMYMCVCMYIYT